MRLPLAGFLARHASFGRIIVGAFLLLVATFAGNFVMGTVWLDEIRGQFSALRALSDASGLGADIARNTAALRQAARDHINTRAVPAADVARKADEVLRQIVQAQSTMGPEERDMLAGILERLTRFRVGFEQIAGLEQQRDESLTVLRGSLADLRREAAAQLAAMEPGEAATRLEQENSAIASLMLAEALGDSTPDVAEAIETLQTDPAANADVRRIAARIQASHKLRGDLEKEIAKLDARYIGNEGRLIVRVTELLRDQAARREQDVAAQQAVMMQGVARTSAIFFALCLAGMVAGLILVLLAFIRPLARLADLLLTLSRSDQPIAVPYRTRQDEIGAIARAVDAFGQMIAARNAAEDALKAARDSAEAAAKSKGEFLAVMSHEIRTPMSGVIGMIELLEQSRLDADQARCVQVVRDSASALLRIINDILDFSKLDAAKLDLETIALSPELGMESVADALAPAARSKGIGLHVFTDPAIPPFLLGDPLRVRQIVVNLAGNALKFTEQGGVAIRMILLSKTAESARVRLDVEDTGIGIPADRLDTLFQPFTQAESSTGRRFGGTGLGLSITRHLVDLMGGTIAVDSTPGQGTRFSVTLDMPIAAPPAGYNPTEIGLNGLSVRMDIASPTVAADLAAYIGAAGGTIATDAGDVVVSTVPPADPAAPCVLLTDPGVRPSGRTVPVARPVRHVAFLHAIAVATGRMSPDILLPDTGAADDSPVLPVPGIDEALAANRLILVADDHPTNRTVLLRQLRQLGFAAEAVEDGIEALDALEAKPYALLLTDCHMPNLDGFELTAAIRGAEADASTGRYGQHLPIVAVTANALIGEAERCLAAGMDFYLSKPVALPRLREALRRFLPSSHETTPRTAAAEPVQAAGGPVDLAGLRNMFGDDTAFLRDMLDEFLVSGRAMAATIEAALAAGSALALQDAGHKLKGAARSAGAGELSELALRIEQEAAAENWPALTAACEAIPAALARAEAFVAAMADSRA
jgi:signal transduction histidine kinase/DNA-binding response OmpR family regulator